MSPEPEFSDTDEVMQFLPSYRWSREMLTSDALELAAKLSSATADYLATLAARAKSESNFLIDQEDAAIEARQSIETITGEGSDAATD